MKLGLGSAQFGLDYGIANTRGRTSADEVADILDGAERSGITIVDTAPSYGVAEEVLGAACVAGRFDIVTKTPVFGGAPDSNGADELERSLLRSLERLHVPSVRGLLVHNASDALSPSGSRLMERARQLQSQALVGKVGVSVYTSQQALDALSRFAIDIIQVPLSVYDQRILRDGTLDMLRCAGVEVHARSVFLQGLLLMDVENLPERFERLRLRHAVYLRTLRGLGCSPVHAALSFVAALRQVDTVVCGVDSVAQLHNLVASLEPPLTEGFEPFAIDDPEIVDPSKWTAA
jgi:aryl-alcohol dehydrogenase-like predicted oxidoreductase